MAKKQSHTSGPWKLFDQNGVIAVMKDGTDFEIIHWTGFDGSKYDDDTNRANARLIASAPDLLATLEGIVEWFDRPRPEAAGLTMARIDTARDLVARARGTK